MVLLWATECILVLVFLIHQKFPSAMGKSFEEDLTLTNDQKIKLDKFRDIVAFRLPHDWMKEELYLIRWLRARGYNLKDAETMLMNYVKWREDNNMDEIFKENWSEYKYQYRYYLDSRDKEGRPVMYIPGGDWDIRSAIVSGKGPKLLRYIDRTLEEACGLVRELGNKYKNVSQGIAILNVDGFNAVQHGCLRCVPFILRIIVALESHHPGCSEKIIVANVPSIAEPIVTAARGVFAPETNEALKILGTNKDTLKTYLLQHFDKDQLPIELGGTKIND